VLKPTSQEQLDLCFNCRYYGNLALFITDQQLPKYLQLKTFLAFSPPPKIIVAIDEWRRLNWPRLEHATPAANFHITLVFLGEISSTQVQKLHDQLTALTFNSFDVTLSALGFWQKAGIFWLAPTAPPSELLPWVKNLKIASHNANISLEKRRYRPHLTLARRCSVLPPPPMTQPLFSFTVEQYGLFESVRERGKVIYQPLFSLPL